MPGRTVIELARAAVRRIAEAGPVARRARAVLDELDRLSLGPPYTVAIAGDHAARTALLDEMAGEPLFDPTRHDPARIMLTLRRGPRGETTSLRATRRDGSVDALTLIGEPEDAGDDLATEAAVAPAPRALVEAIAPEPTLVVRHPPWWAVWRWLWRWLRRRRARPAPRLPPPSVAPALPALAPPAPPARPPSSASRGGSIRRRFVDTLRACFADDAIEQLSVEVHGGPLPEALVLVELPARASARSLDAIGVDACVVACGAQGLAMTVQLEDVLTIVPHLFAAGIGKLDPGGDPRIRPLGSLAHAAPELARIARIERSIDAGARALALLSRGATAIEDFIIDAEAGFRARIERLEAMRIPNADDHTAAALARARQPVIEHAHREIRRALDDLDRTLERFGLAWSERLVAATSTEALRTTAAQLDAESPAQVQAAQAEAHGRLLASLTEKAQAHYRALVCALRDGAGDAAPAWLTVEVAIEDLTSGTSLGSVAPRLSSLFRSLEALKSEAIAQLEQRVARLRQRASATLLDSEPRLEPAVTGALGIAVRAEIVRHGEWLEAELARERAAIDGERAQLAVLAIARDTARADEQELLAALRELAAGLP